MTTRSHLPTSESRVLRLRHRQNGARFDGRLHVGGGLAVAESVARATGRTALAVVEEVVKGLLVKKGVDWTGTILNEYVGLYADSRGTFCLVTEKQSGRLVAHASVFSSARQAGAGLLAHVRTADGWGGYGLGTVATEAVTGAALAAGVPVVVLETDDRLFRSKQGERAAYGMYGRIGYAVVRERRSATSTGWIMAINPRIFRLCRELNARDQRETRSSVTKVGQAQSALLTDMRRRFSQPVGKLTLDQVSTGDLGGLFLLLNLHPADDFAAKVTAWGVFDGPEFEHEFVVKIRPALAAGAPPEDLSMVLRDSRLGVVAVCAARRLPTAGVDYAVDFYCAPEFLRQRGAAVRELLQAVLARVKAVAEGAGVTVLATDARKEQVLMEELKCARLAARRSRTLS